MMARAFGSKSVHAGAIFGRPVLKSGTFGLKLVLTSPLDWLDQGEHTEKLLAAPPAMLIRGEA